jgi:hypothetical protein
MYIFDHISLISSSNGKCFSQIVAEIETHIFCSETSYFENLAPYEIMWKDIAERGRPQMTKGRMRIACCVTKDTDTNTQVV